MTRSPATRIIPACILLAVMVAVVFIPSREAAPSGQLDSQLGYYLVRTLESNEPVPESLPVKAANGGCFLTSIPNATGTFFMLPHPCAPVIRSIEFTRDGFQAGPRQGDFDDQIFDIKGMFRNDGILLVELRLKADSVPDRWIMRKAVECDFTTASAGK